APASIELAYFIIKGMREDAKASDLARRPQRGRQRKLKQGAGMALALMAKVNRELPEQRSWHWIRLVSLVSLGQKLPFDLSGAERYVTHDQLGAGVADHVHPRDA